MYLYVYLEAKWTLWASIPARTPIWIYNILFESIRSLPSGTLLGLKATREPQKQSLTNVTSRQKVHKDMPVKLTIATSPLVAFIESSATAYSPFSSLLLLLLPCHCQCHLPPSSTRQATHTNTTKSMQHTSTANPQEKSRLWPQGLPCPSQLLARHAILPVAGSQG